MTKLYAQCVHGVVNLIGAEEVGITPDMVIQDVVIFDISDLDPKPQIGWIIQNGILVDPATIPVPPTPTPEPSDELINMALITELTARLEEKGII